MTAPSGWATQQLAEFLSVLASAADDEAAVADALERLAESFEADAGAFVQQGRVIASLGWAEGCTPEAQLVAAAASDHPHIDVAGVGACETAVIPVDRDEGTALILARASYRFTAEEVGLLRGMARVLALGLRLLGTVAVERRQVDENRELVASLQERQALLERLSRIQRKISSRAPLHDVLNAITSGAAELLRDEMVALRLIDETNPDFMMTMSSVGVAAGLDDDTRRLHVTAGVGGRAISEDRLCVVETYQGWDGEIGAFAVDGVRSAMGAPVHLEGRPIGCLVVASHREGRTYSGPEREILVAFAEHVSLALNDARTVQAMNKALDVATHQAMHDELTGLPNRACFYDRTDQALRQAARDGVSTAVLLFDLDRFKEINDTLGHKYGDRLLCEIGPRIRRGLREADTLARLGGDEFCVLLPAVDGLGGALHVAERVIGLLEEPFEIDGMALAVDASCGIAIAPNDGDSADLLLQRSDVAMYVAKDSHANVVIYDDALNVNTPGRLALLGELRTAIAHDELVLHYQPKASLGSGQIQGVEALIRWQHPTLGLIPPDQFIPLAEHTGLIKPLTTWVLRTALDQLRRWRDQSDQTFPADLSMAINLSTRSLLDDSFPGEVMGALECSGIPAHLLELEITESAIMADPTRAYRLLTELAAVGVKLAIDDFGTGYSSLAYLKNLPVDELKIDRSFVLHMHDDPNDVIIVRSVIDLGHNLGLKTVAEGIEDLATWEQLTKLGCDSAQGYFLARPMPASEFGAWLRNVTPSVEQIAG
jgi:diguanylate cyclase (GGDEF)-like protein